MNNLIRNVYDCLIERGEDITEEQVKTIITGLNDVDYEGLDMAISMCDEETIAKIILG